MGSVDQAGAPLSVGLANEVFEVMSDDKGSEGVHDFSMSGGEMKWRSGLASVVVAKARPRVGSEDGSGCSQEADATDNRDGDEKGGGDGVHGILRGLLTC